MHVIRVAAVALNRRFKNELLRFGIFWNVCRNVLKSRAPTRELCIRATCDIQIAVEGAEPGLAHAVFPCKVPTKPRCVSSRPLPFFYAHRSPPHFPVQLQAKDRGFTEPPVPEKAIGAHAGGGDERDLDSNPRRYTHGAPPYGPALGIMGRTGLTDRRGAARTATSERKISRIRTQWRLSVVFGHGVTLNKLSSPCTPCKPSLAVRYAFAWFLGSLPLALGACGEAVARPKPPLEMGPVATQPRLPTPGALEGRPVRIAMEQPSRGIGALEHPEALRRFYEALSTLEASEAGEAGETEDDVRVLQFGDSHTAADLETAALRRALQSRFGDGGRGFVAIGTPWKKYLQEGVRCGMSPEWCATNASPKSSPKRAVRAGARLSEHPKGVTPKDAPSKSTTDGFVGLAGIGVATRQRGAQAWADIAPRTSRAELAYLEQPAGGSFDLFLDGVRAGRVSTKSVRVGSAYRSLAVDESGAHRIEVRAAGDGEVRVFGLSLDRAERGVVVDALGILGARITTALSWDEGHWAEQLRHQAPRLVIFAYGTNESTDDALSSASYERQLVDALGRVARAVPSASCLLLGPPDRAVETPEGWVTSTKLLEIVEIQRQVAEAAGCAFYDQLEAMGGQGTIEAWCEEDPPRAQRDRVHFTRDGYATLGSSLAADLLRGYAAYVAYAAHATDAASRSAPVAKKW